ncbi:MAG: lysophospholipid acyltransferase family protein [Solirubrobacteraceae bacterium]
MSQSQAPRPAEKLVKMKEQVYRDPRPKEHFDRFHERTRTKRPDAMYEIVRVGVTLYSYGFFRLKVLRSELVPQSGPVIIAPNHFSFMDHFFAGVGVRRKVQFMAKSQLFARPLQFVYSHGGVFPVRRGERDDDAFITAHTVLERDATLCMYCEGGRSRTGDLAEKPKPGIGRIALESGAPIVPTAIYGSAKVRNWKRGQFPQVTVLYGEPLRFPRVLDPTREQSQAAAEEIFAEIKALYGQLQEHGRSGIAAHLRGG